MDTTAFENLILAALVELQPNAYGVPIQESVSKALGKDVAFGSIYAALDRLEEGGLVTTRIGEATPERGNRRKTYFYLTRAGVEVAKNRYLA